MSQYDRTLAKSKGFYFEKVKWLVAFLSIFLFFSFQPLIFGLKYWHSLYAYKIMWLNLLGGGYKLPLETPKPFIALFAGIFSPSFIYIVRSFFSALLVLSLIELSKEIAGSYEGGIFASFFYFFCNLDPTFNPFLSVYWPVIYNSLLFFFVLLLVKKAYEYASVVLFIAGLIRPESWPYVLFMLFFLYLNKERIKGVYFLPFLAPILWCLFDYKIAGDFLFSYHLTHRYVMNMYPQPYTFFSFIPLVINKIGRLYGFPILALGLIAIVYKIVHVFRMRLKKDISNVIISMAIMPVLLYWFLSAKKVFHFELRFLNFSILTVYFYAAILPFLLFRRRFVSFVFLILLSLSAFRWEGVKKEITARKVAIAGEDSMWKAADFLEQYLSRYGVKGKVITFAENMGYLSLKFGPEFSRRIILFRDVVSNPAYLDNLQEGIVILTFPNPNPPDTLSYLYLLKNYRGKYSFEPLLIDSRQGIYIIKILPKKAS